MNNRIDYLKIVAIVLVIIIILSAGLIILRLWENNNDIFSGTAVSDGVVKYRGTDYELNSDIESYLLIGLDKYTGANSADSHESGIQALWYWYLIMKPKNALRSKSTVIR